MKIEFVINELRELLNERIEPVCIDGKSYIKIYINKIIPGRSFPKKFRGYKVLIEIETESELNLILKKKKIAKTAIKAKMAIKNPATKIFTFSTSFSNSTQQVYTTGTNLSDNS